MDEQEKINNYIQNHYQEIKTELQSYCFFNHFEFNLDAYHDTLYLVLQAVKNGTKINYDKIKDYIFLSYKRATIKTNLNKYDMTKEELNDNIYNLQDDSEQTEERERQFIDDYNLLMKMSLDVTKEFGSDYAELMFNRINGEPLNINNGERGKFEKIKKYLKQKYNENRD